MILNYLNQLFNIALECNATIFVKHIVISIIEITIVSS